MEYTQESLRELAERIYDLDAEVYTRLGSSLGRVFNRDREPEPSAQSGRHR